MTLSDKFKERRKRVNDTCNEYTQAIAHTSFNQIEEDVKAFIKELKKEFIRNAHDGNNVNLMDLDFIIDQKAGDKLI